jgi:hypothetical protein
MYSAQVMKAPGQVYIVCICAAGLDLASSSMCIAEHFLTYILGLSQKKIDRFSPTPVLPVSRRVCGGCQRPQETQ